MAHKETVVRNDKKPKGSMGCRPQQGKRIAYTKRRELER